MTTYNEAQCPICGGFKTTTTTQTQTRFIKTAVTGKLKRDRIVGVLFFVFPVVCFVSFWVLLVVVFQLLQLPESVGVAGVIIGSITTASLTSIWLIRKWTGGLVTRRITEELSGKDSVCQLCGYNWHWDSTQPYPQVRLDPALIAKGEIKLQAEAEVEAEAQARRKRDLEWNHWNQWNNPNK